MEGNLIMKMTSNSNNMENIVQKQNFKATITTALIDNNILQFQTILKQQLEDNFTTAVKQLNPITESVVVDDETKSRIDIESAAKSFGGNFPLYDQGVLIIDFDSKDSVTHFSAWLDDYKTVENYEINVLIDINSDTNINRVVRDVDLNSLIDDDRYTYEFTIYLNPDIVTYSYGDEYDDAAEEFEDEDIAEATRVIKVSSIGQKHIKMKCNPGFKWESESRSCQKISGEDLVNMRKGIKKRLITMKSEGPSLKKRTLIKTRKAMKFRKVMGLS